MENLKGNIVDGKGKLDYFKKSMQFYNIKKI